VEELYVNRSKNILFINFLKYISNLPNIYKTYNQAKKFYYKIGKETF